MNTKKIAVFTTSDLHVSKGAYWEDVDPKVVGSVLDSTGTLREYCSLGQLERAHAQGYHIFVVSSRPKLNTHDAWWVELVGTDNIILTKSVEGDGSAGDPMKMESWRSFIRERLGVEPCKKARTWMDLQWALKDHGIAMGQDFQKEK